MLKLSNRGSLQQKQWALGCKLDSRPFQSHASDTPHPRLTKILGPCQCKFISVSEENVSTWAINVAVCILRKIHMRHVYMLSHLYCVWHVYTPNNTSAPICPISLCKYLRCTIPHQSRKVRNVCCRLKFSLCPKQIVTRHK